MGSKFLNNTGLIYRVLKSMKKQELRIYRTPTYRKKIKCINKLTKVNL